MIDIRFETGIEEIKLNDTLSVYFNPTDVGVVERIFDTFDILDKKQDEYRKETENNKGNTKAIFETARRMDKEVRELIDGIFGKPICDALFGATYLYALADGLPIWCNLMLAIIDKIDTTFARERKLTNPRITKYTERWRK